MNCPSRSDNTDGREGWNQSPNLLAGSTREDFNGMANARTFRRIVARNHILGLPDDETSDIQQLQEDSAHREEGRLPKMLPGKTLHDSHVHPTSVHFNEGHDNPPPSNWLANFRHVLVKFGKFVGPGFMVCLVVSWRSHAIFRLASEGNS